MSKTNNDIELEEIRIYQNARALQESQCGKKKRNPTKPTGQMQRARMDVRGMTDCNKCYLSMQNCHDMSICCESEEYYGERCDWFEPIKGDKDDI